MRAVARACSAKHKYFMQEAVYLVVSELFLKTFPKVIFLNSNVLENT